MKRLILLLVFFLPSSATFAAATFVSVTRIDFNAVATNSASVTIPSGNGLFIAYIGRQSTETAFSSVTYNGTPITPEQTTTAVSGGGIVSFGAAYNGISGTAQTLSITLDAVTIFGHAYAIVYANPDLTAEIGDSDGVDGFTSPAQVSNTSDANALHICLVYWRTGIATITPIAVQSGNSQTQLEAPFENGNGNTTYGSYRPGSGGGTAQSGFTFTDSSFPQWGMQSWRLNGAGGGAGGLLRRRRAANDEVFDVEQPLAANF